MTNKQFNLLKEIREIFSVLGWLLMVLNFSIALVCLAVSFITHESILGRPGFVFTILSIVLVIGIMAVLDRSIYKALKNAQITDKNVSKSHL